MRGGFVVLTLALTGMTAWPAQASPFDGARASVLACPTNNGALGFSYRCIVQVEQGILHGAYRAKGRPSRDSTHGAHRH